MAPYSLLMESKNTKAQGTKNVDHRNTSHRLRKFNTVFQAERAAIETCAREVLLGSVIGRTSNEVLENPITT